MTAWSSGGCLLTRVVRVVGVLDVVEVAVAQRGSQRGPGLGHASPAEGSGRVVEPPVDGALVGVVIREEVKLCVHGFHHAQGV